MSTARVLKSALVVSLVLAGSPVWLLGSADPVVAGRCTVTGTAGNDVLRGTAGNDVICGLGGNDKLVGRGGDDVLRGGGGDDVLRGGAGDDKLAGGGGDDRLVGGSGKDRLTGAKGADTVLARDRKPGDRLACGADRDVFSSDPGDTVGADCEALLGNHAPTGVGLAPSSVPENSPAGTTVGTLSATDADAGDTATFALVPGAGSGDNAAFTVVGSSLRTAAVFDFEADPAKSVRVRATDRSGASVEKVLTVAVSDVAENAAPVAVDDAVSGTEDTDLELPVSGPGSPAANDTDAEGDALTVTGVGTPVEGNVSITGGKIVYVPAPDACGDDVDQFGYTVADGRGGTDTGVVVVSLTCTPDAASAVDDAVTRAEDSGALAVDVLGNDSDPDTPADPFGIVSATDPAHGAVVLTGGSAGNHTGLTYAPDADYCNEPGPAPADTFDYTITGGDTATVSVTVTCTNDAPVAVDDAKTTTEDTQLSLEPAGLLGNDADVDGDTLRITAVSNAQHGTVSLPASKVTFDPAPDYCGAAGFDYTVTDDHGGTDTGHVDVTVTCVNDAPVAVDDDRTVAEDSGATTFASLLGNDTDAEDDPITITAAGDPTHGSTTFTASSVTYTPHANYCGPDSFTYTVNGGDTATVSVTVTCTDDAPEAVADAATVLEDAAATPVPVLANDTDADGDPITIASASDPGHGTVGLTGPAGAWTALTYTPDADYCNTPTPPFDTFTYSVNGGDSATVSMTVTCVDDAPVAVDDSPVVTLNVPATPVDVLANDTDVDAGPISIASASDPDHGTVVLTGPVGARTGLTYQPDAGYCNTNGADPDDVFTYTLAPGGDTATVSVTVSCDAPPTAVDDVATVTEDAAATAVGVLANDTDTDGGLKVITAASDPAHGTVVLTGGAPGARTGLTYQPDADYCNSPPGSSKDTFTYTLNGGSTATVSMTVTCVDDAPVAVADTATVLEDSSNNAVPVLANDTDVDGGTTTVTSVTQPAHGTVVNGSSNVSYTPAANYCNSQAGGTADTFTYTVNGGSTATVSVTVTCVNDAPDVTVGGSLTYTENAPATPIAPSATVTDPDPGATISGATVKITVGYAAGEDLLALANPGTHAPAITASVAGDTLTLSGTASPAAYQAALRDVTYADSSDSPSTAARTVAFTVSDGTASDTDLRGITVTPVDDPPTAVNDAVTVLEDSAPTATNLLANDTDVDSGPKNVVSASDPAHGTTQVNGPGTNVTYAPDANYCNSQAGGVPDTFTYTLTPGGSTATVSVTVTCVNDAPVAGNETFNGTSAAIGNTSLVVDAPGDGPMTVTGPKRSVSGNILANDTDVDGPNALQVVPANITSTDGGSVSLQADGDFTYLPDDDPGCGDGTDSFTYTVTDGNTPTAGTATGIVTVAITECVWYVDPNAAPGGDGRSPSPLKSLTSTDLNGAGGAGDLDDASDYLFVYGNGALTTGIVLETNQRLWGQPNGLTVDGTALVTAGSTNPTIRLAGGTGITLANGVDVQRVDAGVTGLASSTGIGGTNITTATIGANTLIQGNGTGLDLDGGTGNITVASTISGNGGLALDVTNRGGGTLTLSGSISTNGNGTGINLATNTGATIDITGQLTLTSPGGGVNALSATGGGTITASNAGNGVTSFSTGAAGLNLANVAIGAAGITFANVTGNGGAGVSADTVTGPGSLTVTSGTITGTRGLDVNGGTASITIGASLTAAPSGKAVEITNRTGTSTVDINGLVTDNATGITMSGNSAGTTVRFDGGVVASTGTSNAFTATGGGTVVVTDANGAGTAPDNTLTTASGTALTVTSTNIGADGLTFRSISSTGASASPGIVLNATGSSGGLTVTGVGTTAGTGGTISTRTKNGVELISTRAVALKNMNITGNATAQNVAGAASTCGADLVTGNNLQCVANVYLQTTTNVTLDNATITGSGQQGINGNGVNGLTITSSTVNSNGNESFESGILLQNASGTVTITGTSVRDNRARELQIGNGSGTMTLATSTSQYGHASAGTGTAESQQGILLQLYGTSNTTVNASSLTFANNQGNGFTTNAFQINADNGGPVVSGGVTGSTFDTDAAGVFVNAGGTSAVTFNTTGNTFVRTELQSINYTVLGGSSAITANLTGTISGNTIGTAAANGCITAAANCHAIDVNSGSNWSGQMHLLVDSNQVQKVAGGIITTLEGSPSANAVTPQVDVRLIRNTVSNSSLPNEEAVKLNAAVTSANPKLNVCWDVGGSGVANTITGDWATGASQSSLYLRNRFTGPGSIRLPGYSGGNTDDAAVTSYLAGRNSVTAGPTAGQVAVLVTHTGTTPFAGGAACSTP